MTPKLELKQLITVGRHCRALIIGASSRRADAPLLDAVLLNLALILDGEAGEAAERVGEGRTVAN